ncbi:MAG: hypothetical protein O3C60_00860 [Planctomycetota bacterium]|nr:hypothetical protein [Planctomycetota bacterium]
MPYPAFSIVADDLTGACDAAAPFADRGWSVWVTWRLDCLDNVNADVVSVCTKSRADSPGVAAEKNRLATQCLPLPNSTRPFKKIDSTLKGHWTHEVLAAMRGLHRRSAMIAPAYPARGRCFVDGQLTIHGEVRTGILDLSLLTMLSHELPVPLRHITLRELSEGPDYLRNVVHTQPSVETMFVVDGTTDRDLEIVAESLELLGDSVLPVGTAGLATAMAALAARNLPIPPDRGPRQEGPHPAIPPNPAGACVVTIVGSSNICTQDQVALLRTAHDAAEFILGLESVDAIVDSMASASCIVVRLIEGHATKESLRLLIAACQRCVIAGLVMTGGDTAQTVMDHCDAHGLWLDGEIETGIPTGRIEGGTLHGLRVATKAGGFGDPHAIDRIVRFLQQATPVQ